MVGLMVVALLGADGAAVLEPETGSALEQMSREQLVTARQSTELGRPNTAGWVTGALFGAFFSLAGLGITGAFAIGGTGDVSSTIVLIGAPLLAVAVGAIPLFVVSVV